MNDRPIGLSTRAQQPGEPPSAFCDRARELGFSFLLAESDGARVRWWGQEGRPVLGRARLELGVLLIAPQPGEPPASLAAGAETERERGVAAACAVAAVAQGARVVIRIGPPPSDRIEILPGLGGAGATPPEPGTATSLRTSDRVLDQLCRGLHEIGRRVPGVRLALATPAEAGAPPLPEDLALLRSELPRLDLRLWHDVALAALRQRRDGIPAARWLDGAEGALDGVLLADTDGERTGLPLGVGLVELRGLADALGRETRLVVAVDADVSPEALAMSLAAARELARR